MEIWKSVVGYEGYYEVSDIGRVRSVLRTVQKSDGKMMICRSRVLRPSKNSRSGHKRVILCVGAVKNTRQIHQLVMEAFVGPANGLETRHLDGNAANNRLLNLAYGTHQDNADDMVRHGTSTRGEDNPRSVLTDEQVLAIVSRLRSGQTSAAVAMAFGVSKGAIDGIRYGANWSHLTGIRRVA